ncbi:hypothetical protein N665_0118s0047 [Sinapis alba]|nr:hypothetical protein N665_0118s0047 [Sinapis alba]
MVSMEGTVREHVVEVKRKEEECDVKQSLEADVMRLVLEMQTEEVVAQLKEKHEELKKELSLTITEKSNELKKKEEEFQLKQDAEARDIEVKMNSLEVKEKNFEELMRELEVRKQELEERQKDLSLLDETIKAKVTELEKRNEKQEAEAKEIEVKMNSLEVKEKQLVEREELLKLKEKELATRSKSRKRCRDEFELSLLAEKDVDDPDPASASQEKGRETYEVTCIDDGTDEEPEPYCCPDADFNSFNNTMSFFAVGQVWALYDPFDHMPRFYAQIRKVLEPQLRVKVRWLEPKQTRENKKPIPIACGEFKNGERTINSYLTFSHLMHHIRTGKKGITINPRKGETWALFSDWNSDDNRKRPYQYDFVQVVSELDSDNGIGVAYLGRVEGFTSVYKPAEQNGVLQMMIRPEEMLRFSHRVPSFVLTGDEGKGVPAGSFELDPAAIPKDCLEVSEIKQEESVEIHSLGLSSLQV